MSSDKQPQKSKSKKPKSQKIRPEVANIVAVPYSDDKDISPEPDMGIQECTHALIVAPSSNDSAGPEFDEQATNEITKQNFYYGPTELDDLHEVLTRDGDFCIRLLNENDRWVVQVVVMQRKLIPITFRFFDGKDGKRVASLTGEVTSSAGLVELLHEHIIKKIAVDDRGTLLVRAISRPNWQLKRENLDLEQIIGSGAFGSVYKGSLRDSKKPPIMVAIKVTKVTEENKAIMQEMLSEARLMRRLIHVNVVRFLGIINDGKEVMIVMELIDGGSLDKYLQKMAKEGKPLANAQKCKYCADISAGVHFLHERRMIHRDLAARNCLIDLIKKVVKISDFGMSKKTEEYRIAPTEKAPIRWMAPEAIRTGVFTRESDAYSMGIIFYEILMDGKQPFDEFDNATVKRRINEPEFRLRIPNIAPPLLKEMFEGLLEHNPAKRKNALWALQKLNASVRNYLQNRYFLKQKLDKESRERQLLEEAKAKTAQSATNHESLRKSLKAKPKSNPVVQPRASSRVRKTVSSVRKNRD